MKFIIKNRKQRKRMKGSYTVESAILIPLGIGVILCLLSGALFLHDRVAVCSWVHETAQWEGFQKRKESPLDFSTTVLLTMIEGQTDCNGREAMITRIGDGRFLSPLAKVMFFLKAPHMEEQEKVKLIYGEEMVRLRKFLEGVYEGGSDLQERTGT